MSATTASGDELEALARKAMSLAHGTGVAKDEKQALELWRQCAEKGHTGRYAASHCFLNCLAHLMPISMFNLAVALAKGLLGCTKNETEAAVWYRKAAENNHIKAQFDLAVMIHKGRGVPRGETEAVHYFWKAAQHGHAPAQFNLGLMLEAGRGYDLSLFFYQMHLLLLCFPMHSLSLRVWL